MFAWDLKLSIELHVDLFLWEIVLIQATILLIKIPIPPVLGQALYLEEQTYPITDQLCYAENGPWQNICTLNHFVLWLCQLLLVRILSSRYWLPCKCLGTTKDIKGFVLWMQALVGCLPFSFSSFNSVILCPGYWSYSWSHWQGCRPHHEEEQV